MGQNVPAFETDRLILSQRTMDHLEDCMQLDGDPDVMKYIRPVMEPAQRRARLEQLIAMDMPDGQGWWMIAEKARPEHVCGWAILVPLALDVHQPEVEVGYRLHQHAWGRGIATEAARRLVRHGFETLDLPRLVGVTHPENDASGKVLQKSGLRFAGAAEYMGQAVKRYSVTKKEWQVLPLIRSFGPPSPR